MINLDANCSIALNDWSGYQPLVQTAIFLITQLSPERYIAIFDYCLIFEHNLFLSPAFQSIFDPTYIDKPYHGGVCVQFESSLKEQLTPSLHQA
jgi:hypothetical protein